MLYHYRKPLILSITTLLFLGTLYALIDYLHQPANSIVADAFSLLLYVVLFFIELSVIIVTLHKKSE